MIMISLELNFFHFSDLLGTFYAIELEDHIQNFDGLTNRLSTLLGIALNHSNSIITVILYNSTYRTAYTGYVM